MELIITAVVIVVLAVVAGVALLRGRRDEGVGIDAEMAQELKERAPQVPPPAPPGTPDDTAGVHPPLPTDLSDPRLAGPQAPPEPEVEPVEPVGAPEPRAPAPVEAPPRQTMTIAERFRLRLGRARGALGTGVAAILRRGLDEEAFEELEDALISADVGVDASLQLVQGLRDRVREESIRDPEEALALLKEILRLELSVADRTLRRREGGTTVWLLTGVNGTGKTTSIGKIAARATGDGEKVVLAAADTFRAAAAEQLLSWGERAGARVVRQGEGADPAAVAFDGWRAADAADADLLLVDTAGRLQNKRALMDELSKVKRVLEREAGPCEEVLLVLDATTGQNGLSQARAFTEAVAVTGVVLTKLDGTAKGGIVLAIQRELDLPVKLVGLGEGVEDLAVFDPDAFVDALFAGSEQDVSEEPPADGDGR